MDLAHSGPKTHRTSGHNYHPQRARDIQDLNILISVLFYSIDIQDLSILISALFYSIDIQDLNILISALFYSIDIQDLSILISALFYSIRLDRPKHKGYTSYQTNTLMVKVSTSDVYPLCAILPSHSILTPGQPTLALTL